MTSTNVNVGFGDDGRSSSRVLRPPGGGHTDIFGGDPEPPRGRRLFPQPGTAAHAEAKAKEIEQVKAAAAAAANGTDSSNQNGAATPETVAEPPAAAERAAPAPASDFVAAEAPKAEAPKRVRVPPGGFSSGLW